MAEVRKSKLGPHQTLNFVPFGEDVERTANHIVSSLSDNYPKIRFYDSSGSRMEHSSPQETAAAWLNSGSPMVMAPDFLEHDIYFSRCFFDMAHLMKHVPGDSANVVFQLTKVYWSQAFMDGKGTMFAKFNVLFRKYCTLLQPSYAAITEEWVLEVPRELLAGESITQCNDFYISGRHGRLPSDFLSFATIEEVESGYFVKSPQGSSAKTSKILSKFLQEKYS